MCSNHLPRAINTSSIGGVSKKVLVGTWVLKTATKRAATCDRGREGREEREEEEEGEKEERKEGEVKGEEGREEERKGRRGRRGRREEEDKRQ